MSKSEAQDEIEKRTSILDWMIDNEVNDVDRVGKVIAEFYKDEDNVMNKVKNDKDPSSFL